MRSLVDLTIDGESAVGRPSQANLMVELITVNALSKYWLATVDREVKILFLNSGGCSSKDFIKRFHDLSPFRVFFNS